LFALAREEVRGDVEVVGAVDAALGDMSKEAFLVALPSLRRAFTYFPPRERHSIAERVLALHSVQRGAMDLLAPLSEVEVTRGLALDAEVGEIARRFGLSDEEDGR